MLRVTNEKELHEEIVKYVRRFYKDAIMIPNLVEFCGDRLESWKRGYTRGTPDLVIANSYANNTGLAIEFKTPKGCGALSHDQSILLCKLRDSGYQTFVSSDFHAITKKIDEHMDKCRVKCSLCQRHFKSEKSLYNHITNFHRVLKPLPSVLQGLCL